MNEHLKVSLFFYHEVKGAVVELKTNALPSVEVGGDDPFVIDGHEIG